MELQRYEKLFCSNKMSLLNGSKGGKSANHRSAVFQIIATEYKYFIWFQTFDKPWCAVFYFTSIANIQKKHYVATLIL
jgi:hypothetical protein